jgi:hypothetical protein
MRIISPLCFLSMDSVLFACQPRFEPNTAQLRVSKDGATAKYTAFKLHDAMGVTKGKYVLIIAQHRC